MNYLTSAITDIGIKKNTNQDAFTVKTANTNMGKIVFAVLCDGMGGLEKGEVASASVTRAFSNWFLQDLPQLLYGSIDFEVIQFQWNSIVQNENNKIMKYGQDLNVRLGTTVTVILFVNDSYCILNIGDGRVYYIKDSIHQLTKDQTVIEKEIELGRLTPEQAKTDPRRSVLLQCVGSSNIVVPDFFIGKIESDSVYMLCTDGFRHEISSSEIFNALHPSRLLDVSTMEESSRYLIQLNKERLEQDNMSVVLVRTY